MIIFKTKIQGTVRTPFLTLPDVPLENYIVTDHTYESIRDRIYLNFGSDDPEERVISLDVQKVLAMYCQEYNSKSMEILTLLYQSFRNWMAINEGNRESRITSFGNMDVKFYPNTFKLYTTNDFKFSDNFPLNGNFPDTDFGTYLTYLIFNYLATSYSLDTARTVELKKIVFLARPIVKQSKFSFTATADRSIRLTNISTIHEYYYYYFNLATNLEYIL